MTVEEAKKLRIGQWVQCPADRGAAPFAGRVRSVGVEVYTNIRGTMYVWVHVSGQGRPGSSVWPSNRIN